MHIIGRLNICGMPYTVAVATAEEQPILDENEGWTEFKKGQILLRDGASLSRMRDTLVHEIAHAFLEATGVGAYLQSQVDDWEQVEETLVRLIAPNLVRLIDDNDGELSKLLSTPRSEPRIKKGLLGR